MPARAHGGSPPADPEPDRALHLDPGSTLALLTGSNRHCCYRSRSRRRSVPDSCLGRRTEAPLRPDAWHPVHRHDVAVYELAIGGSSGTVAVATRQKEGRGWSGQRACYQAIPALTGPSQSAPARHGRRQREAKPGTVRSPSRSGGRERAVAQAGQDTSSMTTETHRERWRTARSSPRPRSASARSSTPRVVDATPTHGNGGYEPETAVSRWLRDSIALPGAA